MNMGELARVGKVGEDLSRSAIRKSQEALLKILSEERAGLSNEIIQKRLIEEWKKLHNKDKNFFLKWGRDSLEEELIRYQEMGIVYLARGGGWRLTLIGKRMLRG